MALDPKTVEHETATACLDCSTPIPGCLAVAVVEAVAVSVWLCPACCAKYPHPAALRARVMDAARRLLERE